MLSKPPTFITDNVSGRVALLLAKFTFPTSVTTRNDGLNWIDDAC